MICLHSRSRVEVTAIETPRCKRCGADFVRLSRQWGVIERLLSRVETYPFRCQSCAHRFFVRQVGQTYRPESDKREYARVKAEFTLTFKGAQVEGKGRLVDLSIRGCSMETDQIPQRGDILQLTLKMPNARSPVDIEAAVVRFTQGIRIGMEFLRINEKSDKELREFVEERLARQKATQEA